MRAPSVVLVCDALLYSCVGGAVCSPDEFLRLLLNFLPRR
jgi:hypothetical protein